MRVTVHDTLSQTRSLLAAPLARRPGLLMDMLAPVLPMYSYAPAPPIESHHLGNGFRVDVDKPDLYGPALDRMAAADIWGQVERCLTESAAYQLDATPGIATAGEVHVVVLLG